MARITSKWLHIRFNLLAQLAGWPTGSRWTKDDKGNNMAVVGVIWLEHNSVYGWSINRMCNEHGGERRIAESMSAREMDAWLTGAIAMVDGRTK